MTNYKGSYITWRNAYWNYYYPAIKSISSAVILLSLFLLSSCSQMEQSKVLEFSKMIGLDLSENNHQLYEQEYFRSNEILYAPYKKVYEDDIYHDFEFDNLDFLDNKPSLFGIDFSYMEVGSKNQIPYRFVLTGGSPSSDYIKFFLDEVEKVMGQPDETYFSDNLFQQRWGDRKSGFELIIWDFCLGINEDNCISIFLMLDENDFDVKLPVNNYTMPEFLNAENISEDLYGVSLRTKEYGLFVDSSYVVDYNHYLYDFLQINPKFIDEVEYKTTIGTNVELINGTTYFFANELKKVFNQSYHVEVHYMDRVESIYHYPLERGIVKLNDGGIDINQFDYDFYSVGALIATSF